MKTKNTFLLVLTVVVMILSFDSCQKDKLEGSVVDDQALIENLLAKAADSVITDNQKLILETELYRNLFPGVLVQ